MENYIWRITDSLKSVHSWSQDKKSLLLNVTHAHAYLYSKFFFEQFSTRNHFQPLARKKHTVCISLVVNHRWKEELFVSARFSNLNVTQMHRYISSTRSFSLRCWTVEIYYNICNQAKLFYSLFCMLSYFFFQSDRYIFVNFNTKHIIQTIRFIIFPELRTSKNIYIIRNISIGRNDCCAMQKTWRKLEQFCRSRMRVHVAS